MNKTYKVFVVILNLFILFAFNIFESKNALAYPADQTKNQNVNLDQVTDKLLNEFKSGQTILNTNKIPVVPRLITQPVQVLNYRDMPVWSIVTAFIKAWINLMSLALYIAIDVLKWLSEALSRLSN